MINEANTLDLDDLDDIQDPVIESEPYEESTSTEVFDDSDDFNLTRELLNLQGISDMNKIKFEDESGAVVEKSWDSLSNDEKLMILSHQEDPDISLDTSEIELINQIRESGLTPDQFIQNLQNVNAPEPVTSYEVDYMSDDELFCLDLLDKVGSDNITDEELQEALDNAKANQSLYSKQVASLRTYYKDLEDRQKQQQEIEKQEAAEQEFTTFSNNILDVIRNFNTFQDTPVELSMDEMEDLAHFILTRDASGYSEFGKLLNDPTYFTKTAFWVLKGPEILNEMQNQIKEAYLRGYNESHKPNKVFTKTQVSSLGRNNNKESQYAYFDEDSYLND
jgi:hypothetical protein